MKAHALSELDLVERARHQSLSLREIPEPLLDRAGVDSYPHHDPGLLALLDHSLVAVVATNVARIDAYAGSPRIGRS